MSEVVRLEHEGPLAVLTFDNPPLNLFDEPVFRGFEEAIDRLAAEPPRGVLPEEGCDAAARAFARRLAEGPTRAHAATKAIVAAQKEGGARAADAIVPEVSGALFDTEDLRNAVRSFLADGPGKATYEGR